MLDCHRAQTKESPACIVARPRLCSHGHLRVLAVISTNAVGICEVRIDLEILELLHRLRVATTRAFESPQAGASTETAHCLNAPRRKVKGFTCHFYASSSFQFLAHHRKSNRVDPRRALRCAPGTLSRYRDHKNNEGSLMKSSSGRVIGSQIASCAAV
jgi:hypothetical protein